MPKKVTFNPESRVKIRNGVRTIAEAVGCTMGPSSKTMLIDKGRFNRPVFSRDGVSVAKEIQLEDPEEALGAALVYEASDRTNREAGDGTTQAVVLTHTMVEEGFKYIEIGRNSFFVERGMKKAMNAVFEQLDKLKVDVSTEEQIASIATISCREPDIGQLIASLMTEIGPDGTITVDIKQGAPGREKEVLQGMQIDRGYAEKAGFVTDTKKMEYKAEGVYVVVTDERLTNDETQMWPITEAIIRHHKAQGQNSAPNILFVAPHIEGSAENFLYLNKLKGVINPLFVKAPAYGEQMMEMLQDICTYTGAAFFSSSKGSPLPFTLPDGKEEGAADKVRAIAECAGRAERVIATKNRTAIAGGFGDPKEIKARIDLIRGQISQADSNFNEEMMKERLSRLTTGVGVIRVAAATDTESEELRQRVDDALSAAKAAVEEGILPGGGVALLRALQGITVASENEDEQVGINIVKKACRRPAWQILTVAGENADEVIGNILKPHPDLLAEVGIKKFTPTFGYNVAERKYQDLIANGVMDPKKVVRCALLYSVTQASQILGMNGIVTDIVVPEKKQ